MGEIVDSWFDRAQAILLGRTTYTMMQAYWTQVTDPDDVVAAALNGLPKYVASSTLRDPDWHHTSVLSGEVLAVVRRLEERPGGELQVHGSWELARSLHEAGLVGEYRLLVFPVCVGTGKRLFTAAWTPGCQAWNSCVASSGERLVISHSWGSHLTPRRWRGDTLDRRSARHLAEAAAVANAVPARRREFATARRAGAAAAIDQWLPRPAPGPHPVLPQGGGLQGVLASADLMAIAR